LPFDVIMVRQDVEAMIGEAFVLIDQPATNECPLVLVPTRLAGSTESDGQVEDWDIDLHESRHEHRRLAQV
jgi:hypothetical protein